MSGLACPPADGQLRRQAAWWAWFHPEIHFMTVQTERSATPRIAPAGLVFLAITSVGWGLNWPIMKQILTEWPPLSARGLTGVAGGLLLAALAVMRGQSLRVPQGQWPRLLLSAALNVSTWMTLMGLALLWLPASEAAVLAYTMPVWASLLAWLVLGERMSLARMLALLMAFAGIAALMGGNGINASMEKLPGILMVLVGAFVFAIGTIVAKRLPVAMPLIASSALQIGIGCVPVALAGLLFEHPHFAALSAQGWALMAYMTLIQFCIAYVCWFAALERLPASVAAIGTMAVPVIGVLVSAAALHEPLGLGQIGGLVFTLVGVALAARS
jgi:drug/metabolite transporter (DMT)-like permease